MASQPRHIYGITATNATNQLMASQPNSLYDLFLNFSDIFRILKVTILLTVFLIVFDGPEKLRKVQKSLKSQCRKKQKRLENNS